MLSAFIAYGVIPLYTIIFAGGSDWFTSNLSVIGSLPGRRAGFFFLGVLIGLYYLLVLRKLISCIPRHAAETCLLYTAFALLVFAVSTPYLPDSVPLQAFLHVVSAFSASVLLTLCLCLILLRLSSLSQAASSLLRPYRRSMAVIITVCAFLLVLAGIISSALEIYFILTTTILIQRMYANSEEIAGAL